LGLVRLRMSQSDLYDNVDRNPALPRIQADQTAVTAEVTPRAGRSRADYANGDSDRVWLNGDGLPRATEEQNFDSLSGSAYYDRRRAGTSRLLDLPSRAATWRSRITDDDAVTTMCASRCGRSTR